MKKYFLLWITFQIMLCAQGQQSGIPDLNFAGKGWTAFNFLQTGNYSGEVGKKLLMQADGKYILLAQVWNVSFSYLVRYNSNGTLDSSFGTNGFSDRINLYEAYSVAFQNVNGDMKIVVAGTSTDVNYYHDFGITRFNSNGILDTSFGNQGRVITDFYGDFDEARTMAIQPADNKILVAGLSRYQGGYADFALARYNVDGSLDTDFGSGGKVSTDFFGDVDYANDIIIQSDNKILLAGTGNRPVTYHDFALVRYNSNGSLDTDFGTGGKVSTDFNSNLDIITAIAIQNIGGLDKIVAVGQNYTSNYNFGLARYNLDGSLDTGFDTDGKLITDYNNNNNEPYDVVIQSDNKILVAGFVYRSQTGHDYALFRYNTDGSLDATSFGTGGMAAADVGSFYETAYAICLTSTNIMIAGGTLDMANPYTAGNDFTLVSFEFNGDLTTSFGTGGEVRGYYNAGTNSTACAISLQNVNGETKVLVAGSSNADFALARINSNGLLDSTFGDNGKVFTNFWGPDEAKAVAIQTINGVDKIVVAGTTYDWESGDPSLAIVRYHADGTLDESFGYSGKTGAGFTGEDVASGMAIQNDGKIIVVGQAAVYDPVGDSISYDFGMVRLTADGILDSSFGTNGIVVTDFWGYSDSATSVALLAGGKILVAGKAINTNGSVDFAIARYSITGMLDASFGGGKIGIDFGASHDVANSIAIQTDGKILMAGYTSALDGSNKNFALTRLTSKGKPDLTFGNQGKLITDFNGFHDAAYSIALQNDGKIILTGSTETNIYGPGQFDVALARYTPEGLLDTGFGPDQSGKVVSDMVYSEIMSSSTWKNDRLYIAGTGAAVAGFAFPNNSGLVAVYETVATTLPSITINDVSVNEGDTAKLFISLDHAGSAAITVNFTTQDVSAISKGKNPDYKFSKGAVIIPAGETTAEIKFVTLPDNLTQEGNETFNVNLSLNNQMQLLASLGDGTGVVTIQDVVVPVFAKTSKNDQANKLSVIAYPNPSNDQFSLQLQSNLNTTVSLTILDAAGRVIENRNGIRANSIINLGIHYRPGVYYVQVLQGTEKITMKLIKQK